MPSWGSRTSPFPESIRETFVSATTITAWTGQQRQAVGRPSASAMTYPLGKHQHCAHSWDSPDAGVCLHKPGVSCQNCVEREQGRDLHQACAGTCLFSTPLQAPLQRVSAGLKQQGKEHVTSSAHGFLRLH